MTDEGGPGRGRGACMGLHERCLQVRSVGCGGHACSMEARWVMRVVA